MKRFLFISICLISIALCFDASNSDLMVLEFEIPHSDPISIITSLSGTYHAFINWDDGTIDRITSPYSTGLTHTYERAGTYTVTIDGVFSYISLSSEYRLTKIIQLGNTGLTSLRSSFYNCQGLSYVGGYANLSGVTDMRSAFYQCYSLKTFAALQWDVSNVTSFQYLFYKCNGIETLDLNDWDTHNVESMYATFYYCSDLEDLSIDNWDWSSVTDSYAMCSGCPADECVYY
eukprot:gnl/Dysnectes_brevis/1371_a1540_2420.p1 GENE.gnl/Dysnectes_brevis/1371_a1540_2420~~gnl/Dysnectes_brevis/1371_a1540_2420.p1  ORF type:complete len:232 (-),score=4.38 gnl/Dysnectes_brevis/1371_a1540_2420:119-814(-)